MRDGPLRELKLGAGSTLDLAALRASGTRTISARPLSPHLFVCFCPPQHIQFPLLASHGLPAANTDRLGSEGARADLWHSSTRSGIQSHPLH